MTSQREDSWPALAEHRLDQTGLHVKLDKGFAEGTYCVYVEFDDLSGQEGFTAARRAAWAYCAGLKGQMARSTGYVLGRIEDGSRAGDARRQRDLECTFMEFTVTTADGRFHDGEMQEHFRLAFLRAGQAWDQIVARAQAQRRQNREEEFRRQVARLLEGPAYAGMDAAIKDRLLLTEVPPLAFARRGLGL